MGQRGPKPAPTALKLVRGTRKDRVNTDEPIPGGDVVRPCWLSEAAGEVWTEYAPQLASQQVLTSWDLEAFAGWCDAIVRRWTAARHLDVEGEVIMAPVLDRHSQPIILPDPVTGEDKALMKMQKSPWMLVWKDANEVIARVGGRFGLTPSDRAQLKVGGDGHTNPAGRLLS